MTPQEAPVQDPSVEPAVDLGRMLKPRSVAMVGMSEENKYWEYVSPTLKSDAEIHFVHPKRTSVFGYDTFPSLSDIGRPVDVVMTVTGATVTTGLAEEAADLDIGGMVVVAGGFAEKDSQGAALQARLVAAARKGRFGVIGPNGLGYVNVNRRVSLTIASDHKRRPGGISVVSQSGAMLSGIAMAAWDRPAIGLNMLISSGNEAATDIADFVEYLAEDPETTAIGLVIEKVRRPDAFFAAVRKAVAAGKPIVAMKLARSARTQELAASHTGAMTGDAWVYDVALAQEGVAIAMDPDELVDRLAIMSQIPSHAWTRAERLGIVTFTGGFASLSMDLATVEGVDVPPLDHLREWVAAELPGVSVPNPLDATGLGTAKWDAILERYAGSNDLDSVLFVHPLAEEDRGVGERFLRKFAEFPAANSKPLVAANCAGSIGSWADDLFSSTSAAAGRGPRGALRGLQTMGAFVRHREKVAQTDARSNPTVVARPAAATIPQPEGRMLPFANTMSLLAEHGIPTAPFFLIAEEQAVPARLPFEGPYVVKLADVAHRTEHGAVVLNVAAGGLADAVESLRTVAARDGLAAMVAVQPMVKILGEALIGAQTTELGPMVVFGLGGIFVEVLKKIGGRMAPFTRRDAEELIAEFEDARIMHGFRGQPGWDLVALADLLVRMGDLAAGARGWIESLEINPLVYGPDGYVAVDALCLVRE